MPPVLEPPQVRPLHRRRKATWAHRIAVGLVRLVILAVILGIGGGGYYMAKRGFGRQWRYRVVEELRKHGVEATIGRLTLDPFRGLVAKNVRIFDYKNRENILALISEVSLDINYAALIHHEPFLNALDVRDAQIILPFKTADEKGDKAMLTNLRAHVYFPPEQIYVSQAEGTFCGIRISATGQLIKRENYQPSPALSAEDWQRRLLIAQRVVNELQKFRFPGAPPSLQIEFSGDVAEIEKAHVEATLRGDRLQRGSYEIRDLSAVAEWKNQQLTIAHCEWSDGMGSFAGRANWNVEGSSANFQARSSLDLKTFLDAFGLGEPLGSIEFQSPPAVEVSGSANFGPARFRPDIIGHAAFGRFTYKAVPFSDLTADFSWDGERTLIRDLRLRHQTGQLRADLFDAPADFRLNIESTIAPDAVRGIAPPELNEFLRQWEWQRPPAIRLVIRGQDHTPGTWKGDGTVILGRSRFRGTWMNSADTKIHFADGALTCEDLHVTRSEGSGTGSFTYDFKKHEVRVSNIKSSLNPAEVIFWIDPKIWNTVVPYKFRRPPSVTANGLYQFRGGKNTRLEIKVDGADGMDYVFLGKTLPFDHISSRLILTNDRLQILDVRGDIFSGALRGNADISLARNNPRYHATLALADVDFPRLTNLYFSYYHYRTVRGRLRGEYDFDGFGTDPRKMNGAGKVAVTDGDVFAIPVFGPISEILNQIVPGTGYSIAHDASTKFTIRDGIIRTNDFNVSGQLFSVVGHGDVYFLDDKIDLDVRISAKGPGIVLTPVYKLFEYKAEGSLKKPNWHPKIF
ncbi:MAG TPA: AsmA-like C-terminal region-containing protein [Candidatus Udaeobacter sp.]|nr:AsmA-like C-terminal region-containing protein [Candidatus Udaeobacter sp.]